MDGGSRSTEQSVVTLLEIVHEVDGWELGGPDLGHADKTVSDDEEGDNQVGRRPDGALEALGEQEFAVHLRQSQTQHIPSDAGSTYSSTGGTVGQSK